MSADSHTVCPKCHPDVVAHEGVIADIGYVLGYPNEVRENYETYIESNGDGVLRLVHDYRADCWDCGWHFEKILTADVEAFCENEMVTP